jgi:hypothetical protein
MKLLNAETMRKDLVGKVRNVRIYNGTAKENLNNVESKVAHSEVIKVTGETWRGSAGREKLLNERHNLETKVRQMNAATGYDAATIQALAGLYVIDLVRTADDYVDYTPVLFTEKFDENAPETVSLRNYMPYIGKEENIMGSGDTVPLMEHNLPEDVVVKLFIRGFGDKTTLRELVFNPFHKTELVIESAARILADEKNNDSIGPIVKATFSSAFTQAADTSGPTYDIQLYNTLKRAAFKAVNLYNFPTKRANGLMRNEVYLMVNPLDLINVQPIVNGNLAGVGGLQQMAQALPITGIVPYGCGLNDGQKYGKEILSYPGVPLGTVYVFVKIDVYGGYRIVKHNETMEVGEGDILGLTSEKRAWHRIRGVHKDWVLPKTEGGKDYGAVVKVTLPEFK